MERGCSSNLEKVEFLPLEERSLLNNYSEGIMYDPGNTVLEEKDNKRSMTTSRKTMLK